MSNEIIENPVIKQSTDLANIKEVNDIQNKALRALLDSSLIINKTYLPELKKCDVVEFDSQEKINVHGDVRIFSVQRIVLENKQSVLESLSAAYTALGVAGYSVFLILDCDGSQTNLYLGVKGLLSGRSAGDLLQATFNGHFPGSELTSLDGKQAETLINQYANISDDNNGAISVVTGVPSLAVEQQDQFMQGLERFIDAAENMKYTALILAEPINSTTLNNVRRAYENIATQISPLLKQTLSFGENESDAVSLSLSQGLSESLGTSLSETETTGTNESTNESYAQGTNKSTSGASDEKKALAIGLNVLGIATNIVSAIPHPAAKVAAGVGVGLGQLGNTLAILYDEQVTEGSNETHTTGSSKGSNHSLSQGKTAIKTTTSTDTKTKSDTQSTGSNRQISLEMTNKSIEQLVKKIDLQLERLDEAERYGAWQTAAYFCADNSAATEALASIFLGLVRGDNSNTESFALNTWSEERKVKEIKHWLANLQHPNLAADKLFWSENNVLDFVSPTMLVSGRELAIQLGLPRRSISTVSVIETQRFGRDVQSLDTFAEKAKNTIQLGAIQHLWQKKSQRVELSTDNLTSHVFVTGSTGSGKSNTVYHLLSQLRTKEIPFLVIEPAKGEYKNYFGQFDDVNVYSTNPNISQLFKINPFKFPDGIHILEHVDRLIEIFNVCWSMYDAMPAVLKDAILKAYQSCGWDLETSENPIAKDIFPNFLDLVDSLKQVISETDYSQEVKGNYTGALVTRVKSLTDGLNGQIFSANEIDNKILFDSNVIVDLSRVGSQETKSLIMGLLIMRLSEYRMISEEMNQPLKHVTVLEEAHNILKRTSAEQSGESANVAGKSVEMLSNAIAEMRTYGEGFIIADQSPSAVDISAIRNTNTKIIMRLPDEQDRRLAGKAAALTDEQLDEVAKLPKGVAVVYQNNWLEAVLCKIDRADVTEKKFENLHKIEAMQFDRKLFNLYLIRFLLSKKFKNKYDGVEKIDLEHIEKGLNVCALNNAYKIKISSAINDYRKGNEYNAIFKDDTLIQSIIIQLLGDVKLVEKVNLLVGVDNAEQKIVVEELKKFFKEKFGCDASNDLLETTFEAIHKVNKRG
ncbi:ATP-binding protein [Lonepinella sp. BR2919]|uniref:ATP-binding protein n=1 Tax=unclassified Lonepinella TaxID=2642006 RepID=UPI003F6E105F